MRLDVQHSIRRRSWSQMRLCTSKFGCIHFITITFGFWIEFVFGFGLWIIKFWQWDLKNTLQSLLSILSDIPCYHTYICQIFVFVIYFRCQSPHHNEESNTTTVWILAVPCDGREECYKGVDEEGCQDDDDLNRILLTGTSLIKYYECKMFGILRCFLDGYDSHHLRSKKSWPTCIEEV